MDHVNSLLDNELDPELPGGDMEFRDVTGIFLEAAAGKTIFHISKEFAYRGLFFFFFFSFSFFGKMQSWSLTIFSSWKVLPCRTP